MTIARTLALALATAALVAPTAQAMPAGMPERPVNAPGATAVDSASVREQDLRHLRAGGDVRLRPAPSRAPVVQTPGDGKPWQSAVLVAAALAVVAATTARVLRRGRTAV